MFRSRTLPQGEFPLAAYRIFGRRTNSLNEQWIRNEMAAGTRARNCGTCGRVLARISRGLGIVGPTAYGRGG